MSLPLPIPQNFKFLYFYLPYKMSKKIYQCSVYVKHSDPLMLVKQQIAEQATQFYEENVGPYDFMLALIDQSDFTLY